MKRNIIRRAVLSALMTALTITSIPMGMSMNSVKAADTKEPEVILTQTGRYDSGSSDKDGGVMEIVGYNSTTGWAYAVNGKEGKLTKIALKDIKASADVDTLAGDNIDIKSIIESKVSGFVYGDMTSIAVSPDDKLLAVAIQAEGYADNGRAAVFTCNADGTLTFVKATETGVQPDMITFSADGALILTANEGEPREGYIEGTTDPKGSVSAIKTSNYTVTTATFDSFDSKREELVAQNIIIKKGSNPSVDFEPEYIAVASDKAYVTLQEANAVAVFDLKTLAFTGVYSVGFEDYSKVAVDINKKDEAYAAATYDSLLGIRMPDSISAYTVDGVDYIVTANEGDSREWGEEETPSYYLNELEVNFGKGGSSPTGSITADNSSITGKVVFYDIETADGLEADKDYLFGGRSFTIFKATATGLEQVYTSGNEFEAKTAVLVPEHFNCSNDDISIDDRSGKKGPEAESVTLGKIGSDTYAFVGLERVGGVMVYNVTDPANAEYVNYINSRDFSDDIAGDDSPEGLCFIPAAKSPNGKNMLLAACEVSGTVAVYEVNSTKEPEGGNNDTTDDTNKPSDDNNSTVASEADKIQNSATVTGTSAKLDVNSIDSAAASAIKAEALIKNPSYDTKGYAYFDLALLDADNKAVQPNGKVNVKLTVPAAIKAAGAKYVVVYRFDDSTKSYVYVDCAQINGEAFEFETDHFTPYLFVGSEKEISVKDVIAGERKSAPALIIVGVLAAGVVAALLLKKKASKATN